MQSQASKIVIAIVVTGLVVGTGVYFWQNNQSGQSAQTVVEKPVQKEEPKPLTYSTSGVPVAVSIENMVFGYTAEQLKGMAEECGSQHDAGYFDRLVAKFSGGTKVIYNFKYTGASQEPDTYIVTLLSNKAGYTSLDQFKKDFDICAAGGDAYPAKINSNWLLFENSCGSGFDDGSGLPVGCDTVRKAVEPTLILN